MRRLTFTSVLVALAVCCIAIAPTAFAQSSKSAAATPAKKDATPAVAPAPAPVSEEVMKARMRPPVKGTAYIDIIVAAPKPVKGELISVVKVKNTSTAPIIGLKIDQYFYHDKAEISAGTGRVRSPIAPGEIVEVTVSSPSKPGINGSQMMFSHANGAVKPTTVKKFTDDTAAAKPAAAPAKKK